jgi:IS5 family transposase
VDRIKGLASHAVQGFENQTGKIKNKVLSIAKVLRRRTREAWNEVDRITQEIIDVTQTVVDQAKAVVEQIQDKGRQTVETGKQRIVEAAVLTEKLISQAKQVVSGIRIIPDRIVSFFDPEARPIKKGKLSKVTEFGFKARIDETESGFVTGYDVYEGNPSDDDLLVPAVAAHTKRFGAVPRAVATDRGFGSKKNEDALAQMDIGRISLPRKGKKSQKRAEYENEKWFQDLQRYRAAGEAKISLLKRKYGLSRSKYRGLAGSKCWVGFGILVHNLQRAAKMLKAGVK